MKNNIAQLPISMAVFLIARIDAGVDLGLIRDVHHVAARLKIDLRGVLEETAQSLVEAASGACPYSLATSGNIDMTYNVITSEPAVSAAETQYA